MVPSRRRPVRPWQVLTPAEKFKRLQCSFPEDAAAVESLMNWIWHKRLNEIQRH